MSPYIFFHSSIKGPFELSRGRIPTFFCNAISFSSLLAHGTLIMTHACCLDSIGDVNEELLVGLGVLASHQHMEWYLATLQRLQMLSCKKSASKILLRSDW